MFLPVEVDSGGYIRQCNPGRTVVHRETRGLHKVASPTLDDVKPWMVKDCHAVLELTEEGGGKALWIQAPHESMMKQRLKIWAGCYGAWPVSLLATE